MADSSFNIQKYFKRGKTVVLTLRHGESDEIRQWSDKDTSHLLLLMSTMFGEFQNQRRRKKDVWAEVSKELTEEGYPWSAEDCRKKWSNMVRTFKGIQEQKLMDPDSSSVKKTKQWPFYDDVLELVSREGADCLPESTNVVQLLSQGTPTTTMTTTKSQQKVSSEVSIDGHMSQDQQEQQHHDEITIVDYQALINSATGNTLDLVDASSNGVVGNSSAGHMDHDDVSSGNILGGKVSSSDGQGKPSSASSGIVKSFFSRKRKKNRTRGKSSSSLMSDGFGGGHTDNSLIDKLIAVTTQHNEKLLEKLSAFHDQSISAMKERNAILSRLCATLEKQADSRNAGIRGDSLSATISPSSQPNPILSSSQLLTTMINKGGHMAIHSDAGLTLRETGPSSQPPSSIRDLNEPILHDAVLTVDSDPIHTIISQDVSTSGLTFHLDVPTSVSDVVDVTDSTISKGFRLENIPSDVNLAAFSATLHPTLVSVNSAKKPRSSLTKSVSVPLHTTSISHRKIAPKKGNM